MRFHQVKELVDWAGGSDEKAFFEALAAGHEAEVRRIARDIQRLEDY
ncbi:hypothetical protein ACFFU2_00780 [Halomonas alkalicola]|uniref:Uncharacterized protein n=1 Tax=Halomonas alkalicola TaxID=1930622 RepID=A0ABY9H4R8_9GAMM|nr:MULTISPECIES: hypothetical protein [Halomonas]PWV74917.1 hypothetical protein DER72_11166 [Halomonas sp. A11-A]WLI73300.1 hypothetical protein B6N23_16535 [Halomonas alkalicola]